MQAEIRRSIISGSAEAPPSVPHAHRAIMISLLTPGQTQISGAPPSQGIAATIAACRSFGADIVQSEGIIDVFGPEEIIAPRELHCGGCNTTLKLMLPLCASLGSEMKVSGAEGLSRKNLSPFFGFIEAAGAKAEYGGSLPASIAGPLSVEEQLYPGMLGSQFLSGLLLCAPLLLQDASIGVDGAVPGWQYVKDTMAMMKEYGIRFYSDSPDFLSLPGGQEYSPPEDVRVPSSPYLSSYLLLAGALCGKATLKGSCDWQAHSGIFRQFGAGISIRKHEISVSTGSLSGVEMDALFAGMLLPHALALASAAKGESKFTGMNALPRHHQSRAKKLCRELGRMGAKITEQGNSIIVTGGKLSGAKIEPEGDAAVAMACAAAAACAQGPTTINGSECIGASYPNFFRDLSSIGAIVR